MKSLEESGALRAGVIPVRLQVNVDHVATVRQARGSLYPDPVEAARVCQEAGADGITAHLREDRRHIQDADIHALRAAVTTRFNLEISVQQEVVDVALAVIPDLITLVPERRAERTTEGGLDVRGQHRRVKEVCERFRDAGIPVSLFVDPDVTQVQAANDLGVHAVEFHTGYLAHAPEGPARCEELQRLADAAAAAASMEVAAGHGLTQALVHELVASVPTIIELNIGHALVSDAIFLGLDASVRAYQQAIQSGVAARTRAGR